MATLLKLMVLVVAGWCSTASLDKTGTSPGDLRTGNKKALEIQGFLEARSWLAEREGFEGSKSLFCSNRSRVVMASLKARITVLCANLPLRSHFTHKGLKWATLSPFCPHFRF
jgi:hypothetical protein